MDSKEEQELQQYISAFCYNPNNLIDDLVIAEAIVFFYAKKNNDKNLEEFGEFLKRKAEELAHDS